jgi:GNAT superfamily N-acetyltransferase
MEGQTHTIRELTRADGPAAVGVVNTAAAWYAEFLPAAEVAEPEMTLADWLGEAERMTWIGAFVGEELVGVIGLEYVHDAVLFRHAYVLPGYQRQGVGTSLYQHSERLIRGADLMIAGTYAANHQARTGLEKAGFVLSRDSEAVLRKYYDIPEERLLTSVTYEKRRADRT